MSRGSLRSRPRRGASPPVLPWRGHLFGWQSGRGTRAAVDGVRGRRRAPRGGADPM